MSGCAKAFRKRSTVARHITAFAAPSPTSNAGKFRVQTEAEQHIWNECSRLIANTVIYYNTLLLSRVYEQKRAAGDHEAADIVKGVSPNAWQHIHLIGAFDFDQAESPVDIDALAARFSDPAFWNRALREDPEPALD